VRDALHEIRVLLLCSYALYSYAVTPYAPVHFFLAFFDNPDNNITHVSGVDTLDETTNENQGFLNLTSGRCAATLRRFWMRFLACWPNWLRWILFLPSALVAMLLAYPIILILNELTIPLYMHGFLTDIFLKVLATVWSTAAFIWVGATIAPDCKLIVSVILTTIYAFLLGGLFIAKLMLGQKSSVSWLEIAISIIVGVVTAIVVVAHFYSQEKSSEAQSTDRLLPD